MTDENNRGVPSRVMVAEGAEPSLFGETDQRGTLRREHNCAQRQVLKARPVDIGAYFESQERPCTRKVTLNVVSRQTPKGTAFVHRVESLQLPDGTMGVAVYKGVLETWTRGILTAGGKSGREGCNAAVRVVVREQVFRVDGDIWHSVKETEVAPQAIFQVNSADASAGAAEQAISFPFSCEDAPSRLKSVEATTAAEAERLFTSNSIKTAETLRRLSAPAIAVRPFELSPEDQTRVKQYVTTTPKSLTTTTTVNVVPGSTLPEALPIELGSVSAPTQGFGYAVVNGKTVVTEPTTRRVIQVIE